MSKKITVKLRKGHPKRNMLARLADGKVIEVGESGVEIAPELVSREMRNCRWYVVTEHVTRSTEHEGAANDAAGDGQGNTENADGATQDDGAGDDDAGAGGEAGDQAGTEAGAPSDDDAQNAESITQIEPEVVAPVVTPVEAPKGNARGGTRALGGKKAPAATKAAKGRQDASAPRAKAPAAPKAAKGRQDASAPRTKAPAKKKAGK